MQLRKNWQRIAGGVGFLLAIGFLATRTCKSESAEAAIRFRLGDGGGQVRSLRVEMYRGDDPEQIGFWQGNFDERGSGAVAGPWVVRADPGLYRLEIAVTAVGGSRRVSRSVNLADGSSITVDVTDAVPPVAE